MMEDGEMATELYRGWEILPDLAGYGYLATQPNYDLGMPCLAEATVEKCKREVDQWIEDNSEEPAVNLLDAVRAAGLRAIDCTTTKDWEQWARERREYEEPYGPIGGRY